MILIIFALGIVVWGGFTIIAYEKNVNQRFESYPPLMLQVEDFAGLNRTRYVFTSNKGQKLIGYMYSFGENPKGIVVIAHGFGGGGHNSYMDCANYFAQHGYAVFAYDATGNDESEGKGVGGIPQGVVDLNHVISFIEEDDRFPDLPIFLFGHSWGAYSVCSVLQLHPEVKAVIACSGCNRASDVFEVGAKMELGNFAYTMTPFVRLYEQIKYGEYASLTAMDGFEASQAAVMIVHSTDDTTVPPSYGYDQYYEKYKDDPRFIFTSLQDRGHDVMYDSRNTYKEEFNKGFDQWLKTLAYDHKAKGNQERFAADKAAYINSYLDRQKWSDRLDKDLFQEFVNFYDQYAAATLQLP
ncbi:MAG: alpha/beta fold hydrolase [Eubacteriales bacterium]|nr:alpha/beta fold hydrolase [Eubacteriales bacterium]